MEFRVLGPTELWSAGLQSDVGPARVRSVLAILLLTPRTIVPAEALIDRLWDTEPPAKARESLSVYVARLRASLRQALGDGIRLAGRANGYVLDVDPETVDLHRFRRLRRQADAFTVGGDYDQAAALLREAEGMWRGQALAGIRGAWVARMRDSLEEERRAAILERVECELQVGRHSDLIGELRGLIAQYPLDETFIGHQMTALYRSGRPADALSLYRETRARLVDEQGTEPGPALSDLHQQILRRDPRLAATPGTRRGGHPVRPDTLPPDAAAFVGRGKELAHLAAEPGDEPRVSLIEGRPGIGKTTLAVRAARVGASHYPDGALYLNLHAHDTATPATDPEEALGQLLRMLGVPVTQIPGALAERAALWRAKLSKRRAIVILDDVARFEQISPLLPASGQSLVLITARRRLPGLDGADVLSLDVLPAEDAATLFTRIAGPFDGGGADQVAAAVGWCGGLPLAIQVTAGRFASDGSSALTGLAGEPSRPTAGLGGSHLAAPDLASAFDLSYRALEPDHQRFFRLLGLSPCADISLPGAAALAGVTLAEAEQAATALLDKHLMARAPAGTFLFHDTIRGYAAMRAADEDSAVEQRRAVGRLLDYYLQGADRADGLLHPFRHRPPAPLTHGQAAGTALATHEDAAAWLDLEWRNILRAVRYACRHEWKRQCADLTHAIAGFVELRGYWNEAIEAHTLALQASRDLEDPARIARASLELSVASQQTGRLEAMLALAEDAAAIYRSLADQRGLAEAIDQIGVACQSAARSREALAYFSEAKILYGDVNDTRGMASALSHGGIACWYLGRYPDAMNHLSEAFSLYRDVGDRRGEAKTLNNLGRMQLHCGYHRDALASFQASLDIFTELGAAQNQANLYQNIGGVYRYKGDYAKAFEAYRSALAIYRDLGDLPDEANLLNDIAAIYQMAECYDEALIHYQQARLIAEEIVSLPEQVISLRGIADSCRGTGRYAEASANYQAALKIARETGDLYEEAKNLLGIAETTLTTRGPYAARILFRQALDIFERLDVPEAEAARIRLESTDAAFCRATSLSPGLSPGAWAGPTGAERRPRGSRPATRARQEAPGRGRPAVGWR